MPTGDSFGDPPDRDPTAAGGGVEPAVRPFGFVADEPLIRQVRQRPLYIGNIHAADDQAHEQAFDHVVTATSDRQPLTTHFHPLDDGPDNDWSAFAAAVDETRACLRADGTTLVHCHAGVSRSATLIATAIAAETGGSFDDALAEIHERRPIATPHPALRADAAIYLAARSHDDGE